MVTVGLFTNKKSGKNKLDFKRYGDNLRIKKLKKIIKDKGQVYETGASKDYMADLEDKIKQVCKDEPDIIAIDGGDGSISTVLTMLDKFWNYDGIPPVAIIEGGTFNVLAKEMDIKKPFKYLENIIATDDADELTTKGINMMRVKDNLGHDQLSFSAAIGFPIDILEEFYKKKHLKYFRVGLMAIRTLGSAIVDGSYYKKFDNKQKIKVTTKGNSGKIITLEDEWLGLMAQSTKSFGMPQSLSKLFQPRTFRNAETEGRFHAVGMTIDFRKFLQYLPSILIGDSTTYTDWEGRQERRVLELDKQLSELTLESEKPIKYQFNGELNFGSEPCKANEIYITADKHRKFIQDDF